jgi:O-antigen ligase
MQKISLILIIIVASILISAAIPKLAPTYIFWGLLAIILFIISFINTRIALYILIFSMLFSPEFGAGTVPGRGLTLRIDDFIVVILGISWLAKAAIYKDLGLLLRTPLNRPIMLYSITCFISTAIGIIVGRIPVLRGFLFVLKYIEYFSIYFMVVNNISDKKEVKSFINSILLTSFLISIASIIFSPVTGRVTALFEGSSPEPNTFGGYIVIILGIAMSLFIFEETLKKRFLYGSLIIILMITLILTQSRTAWIGFLVMFSLFLFTSENKKLFIIITLLIVFIGLLWMPHPIKERINETFYQEKLPGQLEIGGIRFDLSTSERIRSFKSALHDFPKHPIFGYGVTGWKFIDSQYLRTLIETGIIGFSAFIFLLYALLKEGFKVFKSVDNRYFKAISFGFFISTISLAVMCIGMNGFVIIRIMEPFWFIAGIVIILPTLICLDKHII